MTVDDLKKHDLDDTCHLFAGSFPKTITIPFEELWELHPHDYQEIKMHGKPVRTPRWQQAYGVDYIYTGIVNKALPVPEFLQPVLKWAQSSIDPRLNGILLNWYDGSLGHYIGPHRDSIRNMEPGTPIMTLSLGEERVFRLRPYRGQGRIDFQAKDRGLFIMPYQTNRHWTHQIPKSKRCVGKRISITIRALK